MVGWTGSGAQVQVVGPRSLLSNDGGGHVEIEMVESWVFLFKWNQLSRFPGLLSKLVVKTDIVDRMDRVGWLMFVEVTSWLRCTFKWRLQVFEQDSAANLCKQKHWQHPGAWTRRNEVDKKQGSSCCPSVSTTEWKNADWASINAQENTRRRRQSAHLAREQWTYTKSPVYLLNAKHVLSLRAELARYATAISKKWYREMSGGGRSRTGSDLNRPTCLTRVGAEVTMAIPSPAARTEPSDHNAK